MTMQLKRIGKRTYCIVHWGEFEVTLQSIDDDRITITVPRRHLGGLKDGR